MSDLNKGPQVSLPGESRLALVGLLLFLILFAATGPWQVAGREINRFSPPLAFAFLVAGLVLTIAASARRRLVHRFLWGDWSFPGRFIALAGVTAALFLYLVLNNRYHGFEVNAWDFSFYDQPLARPFESGFLFNPIEDRAVLGTHAYFLLLLFLPLYALQPSPYWLLAGQAAALAVASVAGFYCFRRVCRDDLVASLLSAAFLLNEYTARAAQYVFHPEIFYPACLFLTVSAFLARRPTLFIVGVVATALVKEDSLLPLLGLAITATLYYRRYRWALAAAMVAVFFFLVDYYVVLPYFAGHPGPPWYSHYWSKYGNSPPAAALGMALHPLDLARDVLRSGFWRLAGTLALTPLAGYGWLLAAAPIVVPYSAAAEAQLAQLRLYYSLPVLPFVFLAAASGLRRLTVRSTTQPGVSHARYRTAAIAVLLLSAFLGPGYRLVRRQPSDVPARLAGEANGRPLLVQGALLPHVGYLRNCRALMPPAEINGVQGFLIMPAAVPFPFRKIELHGLAEELARDQRFQIVEDRGVLLFAPRSWLLTRDDRPSPEQLEYVRKLTD